MGPRVFYVGCVGEFWADAAKWLEQERGWQAVFWSGVGRGHTDSRLPNEDHVRRLFPEVIFHDALAMEHLAGLARRYPDGADLHAVGSGLYEAFFMHARQESAGDTHTLHDRWMAYVNHYAKWDALVEELRPDLVFHPEIPHFTSDLALMHVARRRGVRTIYGYFTKFRKGRVWTADPYRKSLYPRRVMEDAPLDPRVTEYVGKLRARQYEVPLVERQFTTRAANSGVINWSYGCARAMLGQLLRGKAFRRVYDHTLARDSHITRAALPPTWLRHRWNLYRGGLLNIANYAAYRRLEGRADFTRPYVYFAPSYQPERTTSPDAGLYVDTGYLLRLVRELVPKEWEILYKEHPRNFDPRSRGYLLRDQLFYREISSIPGVRLLSLDHDSFELIDHAKFCVTATGSVGLEAALRGKQAIIWGSPWYEGVDGAFRVETRAEFTAALAKITAGYANDLEYNKRYLNTLLRLEGEFPHLFREREVRELKRQDPAAYGAQVEAMGRSLIDFLASEDVH